MAFVPKVVETDITTRLEMVGEKLADEAADYISSLRKELRERADANTSAQSRIVVLEERVRELKDRLATLERSRT